MKKEVIIVEYNVTCIERIIGNYHTWDINGVEVKLRISQKYKYKIEKALNILSTNLKNNEPIYEAVELINVHECLVLIYKFLLIEFLKYVELYMKQKIRKNEEPTLVSLVEENLKKDIKNPVSIFSREEIKPLRESIALWITQGKIEQLDIAKHMDEGLSMNHIDKAIGKHEFIEQITSIYVDKLENYIDKAFIKYSKKRELLTYSKFCIEYLGGFITSTKKGDYETKIIEVVKPIASLVYDKYVEKLIEGNLDEINSNKDTWKIYKLERSLSVTCTTVDFSKIKSEKFKIDYKRYYKNLVKEVLYSNGRVRGLTNNFATSVKIVNYLYEERGISCFGEITTFEANLSYNYLKNNVVDDETGELLSIPTISKIITLLRQIIEYLMEYYTSTRNHTIPKANIYNSIKTRNTKKMGKKVDVIPEIVFKQIQTYKTELVSNEFKLMFDIFEGTGMRLKEVQFLEADCLQYTDDSIYLSYIPYKVLISRRKAKREDRHTIEISEELAKIIEEQKSNSNELRTRFGMTEIFLTQKTGKIRVIGEGFTSAINKLIKKYNICDIDGEIWRFDSRQMRKTVVATMIENGATETEIMQQLNHIRVSTTREHYEDLEKLKLANLNAEFFEKEFEVIVGEEQLDMYSNEEKEALIIDLKLNKREVEFGYCIKHDSEGRCKKRTGKISCANCPKLCTGKKYIDKWESLITNQTTIIKDLEGEYSREGIQEIDYKQFIEYTKEKERLKLYQSIISKIWEIK